MRFPLEALRALRAREEAARAAALAAARRELAVLEREAGPHAGAAVALAADGQLAARYAARLREAQAHARARLEARQGEAVAAASARAALERLAEGWRRREARARSRRAEEARDDRVNARYESPR